MFSYEFCKTFKNTFSDRTPLVAASESRTLICQKKKKKTAQHEPYIMQRGTLLFMAPEQLSWKYPIKQAKQEDLPNHCSF